MKKDAVVVWIMAIMLIATGALFSATSSQASDLDHTLRNYRCGFGKMPGDKVMGVRLSSVSGNVMSFVVDISVDAAHYNGSDGIVRPGSSLKNVFVEVLAFDGNGNRLTTSWMPGRGGLVGTSSASTSVTLASSQALSDLVDLLVVVHEGTTGGFSFCQVWKYANVYTGGATSQPTPHPPPAPIVPFPPSETAQPGSVELPHSLPQIAGTWQGSNGKTYHLYQFKQGFTWTIEGAREQGTGYFKEKEGDWQLIVSWQGQFGFGETTGKVTQLQGDQATRIQWNNNIVFERQP